MSPKSVFLTLIIILSCIIYLPSITYAQNNTNTQNTTTNTTTYLHLPEKTTMQIINIDNLDIDILPMPKGRGFLDTNDTCLLK